MENNAWVKHFVDMAQGLIPYRKYFYKIQPQIGMGDIQMVTPAQAAVDRAKTDIRRKLQESLTYKPKQIRLTPLSGSGQNKKQMNSTKKRKKENLTQGFLQKPLKQKQN